MSWARATLRRGTSAGSVWQVDANYPQARVAVGAAPTAGWVVTGAGIASFHVELYWDGNALYVADTQGVGDVRLNGAPVRQWTQVQGRGQLVFGHAILELETSVAEATAMVRDPGTAPRISLVDERTRVAQGGVSPPTAEIELEDERTRVASSLDEIAPSKAQISMRPPPPPGRGPSVPPPPPNRAPQTMQPAASPAFGGPERPRLGGAPAAPGRKEAKTLVGEELPPIAQEATRMVDSDALPAPSQGYGGAPQGFGGAPQGFGGAPQGYGGAPQGFGVPQQPGAQQGYGGAPQGFGAPPQQAPQGYGGGASGVQIDGSLALPQPPMALAGPPNATQTGGMTAGTGGFVQPPSFAATQQLKAQNDGSVPRRTRLLIMLFVAVVLAWLMMPTPEEEEAAERAAHPPPVTAPVVPPGVDGGVDAGPRPYTNPSTFVPVLTTETLDGGLSRTPDSVAAQLVNDGHLEDALAQYEALRTAHPERPEYGVMVEVLRRRLTTRCTNGMLWNGQPCAN
jgi:hypothetical protein